jgi:hypothetical protein
MLMLLIFVRGLLGNKFSLFAIGTTTTKHKNVYDYGEKALVVGLCTRDEVRRGQWQKVILDGPPYVSTGVGKCRAVKNANQSFWPSWDWQPWNSTTVHITNDKNETQQQATSNKQQHGSCIMSKWDKDDFCNVANSIVMNNKNNTSKNPTLAIVGDSLSFEHYSSLAQLLGLPSSGKDMHMAGNQNRNIVQSACNWTLIYRRSDTLEHVPSVLKVNEPNVLVINRGAHYVDDQRFMSELFNTIKALQDWQRNCSFLRTNQTCWLFVRSTVPGHPQCENYNMPSNDTYEMEALVANLSNYASGKESQKFHWWDIKHQNNLMLDAFSKSGLAYQVIDSYDINILRPDLHRSPDCLHSCYPGKMDVYNQLLLHFLKRNILSPPKLTDLTLTPQNDLSQPSKGSPGELSTVPSDV